MADSRLEFDIVGHAESAVAAFGETAAAADGAAKAVDRFSTKNKEASIAEQAAADRAAQGFARRFTSGIMMALAGAGGGAEGGGGGEATFVESFGSQFGMLAAGALVAAPAIAAVVAEVDALASGFVASAAGGGAFFALAMPAFKILQTNYSQLVQNQQDFQNASQSIATAIQSSAADAAQYQKSLADPSTRGAIELLNNQNTVWQNLTTTQQNALVALNDNKKAMANLLPDQRTALGILMKEQDAWGNLTPAQQTAAGALDNIRMAYDKMSLAFQPTAFKIFGDALKVVSDLMPKLLPLANAFAGAIGGVLKQADAAVKSKDFQQFFAKILGDVGPATTAIGEGIGKVLPAIGRLFTIMSSHDVVHAINILFDTLAGFFNIMADWITRAMHNWDSFSHDIENWYNDTRKWLVRAQADLANWAQAADNFILLVRSYFDRGVRDVEHWADNVFTFVLSVQHWFEALPGRIINALSQLGEMLFTAGQHAVQRLIDGLGSMFGNLGSMASRLASKVAGFFGLSPAVEGPLSGSGAPEIRGAHFGDALAAGIQSRMSVVGGSAAALADSVAGFGGRGGLPAQVAGAYGSGAAITLYLAGGEGPITDAIMQAIRAEAQAKGGGLPNSVQIAFGVHH